MKKTKRSALLSYMILGLVLLATPYQAMAGSTQTFCAAHDQKLSQDMATVAASVIGLHMAVGGVCSYLALTVAVELTAKTSSETGKQLEKIVPRAVAASRGFFKVIVPTLYKVEKGAKKHNSYWGKVFTGSLAGGLSSVNKSLSSNAGMSGKRNAMKACVAMAKGLQGLRAAVLLGMAYLAISKSVCALAKSINPHCKRSSKHKNKCSLPIYGDLPESSSSAQMTHACHTKRDKALNDYIKLANQYSSKLKAMGMTNKALKGLFSQLARQLKRAKSTASSINNQLKPIGKGMKKVTNLFKPINKGFKMFQSLLRKKVCVSYKSVTTKRVCKKVKIAGKKKKKCVKKPTTTTKRTCLSVQKVSNAASAIQKPMEKAIDKLAKPIMSFLPKKLPIPGLSKAQSLGRKLQSSLNIKGLEKFAAKIKQIKTYKNLLNQLTGKLRSIQRNVR